MDCFPGKSWVRWYQKGKTRPDLNKASDYGVWGWQWHQLDHMQTICTSLQTDNHNNTSSLKFYRPDALPDVQPTVSKQWRHNSNIYDQQKPINLLHGQMAAKEHAVNRCISNNITNYKHITMCYNYSTVICSSQTPFSRKMLANLHTPGMWVGSVYRESRPMDGSPNAL